MALAFQLEHPDRTPAEGKDRSRLFVRRGVGPVGGSGSNRRIGSGSRTGAYSCCRHAGAARSPLGGGPFGRRSFR